MSSDSNDPIDADYQDRDEISTVHLDAVDCATHLGIAEGLGTDQGTVFLPDTDVRREQMTSFVARTLTQARVDLPDGGDPGFEDVAPGATHADAIAQLAAAGIVRGVDEDSYDPTAPVSRDQLASFLVRATAYQADVELQGLQGGDTPFTDIQANSTHGPNIEGLYNLGITTGTTDDTYTPDGVVTREAMASFVVRTFDAMQSGQTVADRDGGARSHTVFTFLSESGRCFQVTAGNTWTTQCEPATDATLQVRTVDIDEGFTVTAGLVTDAVARVAVGYDDSSIDLDLVETPSDGLRALARPSPPRTSMRSSPTTERTPRSPARPELIHQPAVAGRRQLGRTTDSSTPVAHRRQPRRPSMLRGPEPHPRVLVAHVMRLRSARRGAGTWPTGRG